MEFKIIENIKHPLDKVYLTYRNQLPNLVPYLPNVDSIETLERNETPSGIHLKNRWKVNGAIPSPLRKFVGDQFLTYLDFADWYDAESRVEWRFEMGAFPEAIDCHGMNCFRAGADPSTSELTLSGVLTIDLSKMRAIPRLLHGLAPTFESFILNLVRPNLSAVCQAVGKYLDVQT